MRLKLVYLAGLLILAAVALQAQGPVYWSNTPPDCGLYFQYSWDDGTYSCEVTGTLPWYAAGGAWATAIRTAAPNSGDIRVDYNFYDMSGYRVYLDSYWLDGPDFSNQEWADLALYADQPAELDVLGQSADYPNYGLADGNVYVFVYCADQDTCSQVSVQMIYSALPAVPYSISVPMIWDPGQGLEPETSTIWEGSGIDYVGDASSDESVGFVICNEDEVDQNYLVYLYDDNGNSLGFPASIPVIAYGSQPVQMRDLGFDLSQVQGTILKMLVVQEAPPSDTYGFSITQIQFNGPSATGVINSGEMSAPMMDARRAAHRLAPKHRRPGDLAAARRVAPSMRKAAK